MPVAAWFVAALFCGNQGAGRFPRGSIEAQHLHRLERPVVGLEMLIMMPGSSIGISMFGILCRASISDSRIGFAPAFSSAWFMP
jgi:hypothetical protein